MLLAVLLSLALLLIDQRTQWLQPARQVLSYVTGPVHMLAHAPANLGNWVGEELQSRGSLLEDNKSLKQQNLILRQKAQQVAVLRAENTRLRDLLNSSTRVTASVSVAEIIGISPDPDRQEVVINRGSRDGVHVGQVVLDAYGVMGQVASVGAVTAHVLLITDASHALSVQDNRNGLHSILAGSGQPGLLHFLYVPVSADVKEGDLLVSTGLEGRFPRGYPVATVTRVERTSGSPFLRISADPKAHITRASHVLLVTHPQRPLAANHAAAAPATTNAATPSGQEEP